MAVGGWSKELVTEDWQLRDVEQNQAWRNSQEM